MAHDQKKPKLPEEEGLNPEKESQEGMEQTLQEETPEGQMAAFWAGLIAFSTLGRLDKRYQVLKSFRYINNPNFEYELMKVRDPTKFQTMVREMELTKKEVERQRKSKGAQKRGYAQVRLGPLKRFQAKIDFSTFDHKEQAFKLANTVQNKINAQETKLKIERTTSFYGLNTEGRTQLIRGMAKWQKENPGGNINLYFQQTGQRLSLEQQLPAGEELKGRKKEKAIKKLADEQKEQLADKAKQINQELEGTRIEAIKENREQIIAAQTEIRELLDINKPLDDSETLRDRIYRVLHPEKAEGRVKETSISMPMAEPEGAIIEPVKPVETQGPAIGSEVMTGLRRKTPISPSMPVAKQSLLSRINLLQNRVKEIRKAIYEKVLGRAIEAIKTQINAVISRITRNVALKVGSKLAVKTATQAALGTATGGIYTAVSAIGGVLGIDVEQLILKAAVFVVAVPVGILIIGLLFIGSKASKMFGLGLINAYTARVRETELVKNKEWQEFENKYLIAGNKTGNNWVVFEKNKLFVNKNFLSSEK